MANGERQSPRRWCQQHPSRSQQRRPYATAALTKRPGALPESCFDLVELSTTVTVDCDKFALCKNHQCACTSDHCESGASSPGSIRLRRRGDELIGDIDGAEFLNARGLQITLGTIRFRRAP